MDTISDLRVVLPILWQAHVTNPYSIEWQAGVEGCLDSISTEGISTLSRYPDFLICGNKGNKIQCVCGEYIYSRRSVLTYHCWRCEGAMAGFRHTMQHLCWQLAHKAQCRIADVRIEWLELIMIEYLATQQAAQAEKFGEIR